MKSLVKKNGIPGVVLLLSCLLWSISGRAQSPAVCTINDPSDVTGCKGTVTFNATSMSSSVNHHVWYDQYFNALAPTTEHMIEYQPGTGQVAWTSSLTVSLQGNATYYVAASCDTDDKRAVHFTSKSGAPVSVSLSPNVNPLDVCTGQTITITASGGTDYKWRYNNPNDPDPLRSATKQAAQSGTYYLSALNECGEPQSQQVVFDFTPPMTNVGIDGEPGNVCTDATPTFQFTAQGDEVSYFSWAITGNGNTISPSGLVTWDPAFYGSVDVTMSANGCNNSSQTVTKHINVIRRPTASITPATSVTIPFRTDYVTLTALSGAGYSYQWFKQFGDADGIEGATENTLIVSAPGSYYVHVTNTDGCAANSLSTTVNTENNYNYIIENQLQDSKLQDGTAIDEAGILTLDAKRNQQSIQYIDGLGRPMQKVSTQATPSQKDLVQPVTYDAFGREATKYLPYASSQTNGWYKVNPVGANAAGYTSSDQYQFYHQPASGVAQGEPYAVTVFEPSPANRVLKQGATGSAWQPSADPLDLADRTVKHRYEANLDTDVLLFNYDDIAGTIGLKSGSAAYYTKNDLNANRTIDEQGNEIIEYSDLKGRVICKRVQSGISGSVKSYANTYYVYDTKDRLVVVVPPEARATILNQPH